MHSSPSFILMLHFDRHTIKPGTPGHGTGNTGETLDQWRDTDGTPEHWHNSGTLAEQSEYHRKVKQENTSIATEQQNNIKKYY